MRDVGELLIKLKHALDKRTRRRHRRRSCASTSRTCASRCWTLSKCPDFVVNRGHYFGTAQFNRQEA